MKLNKSLQQLNAECFTWTIILLLVRLTSGCGCVLLRGVATKALWSQFFVRFRDRPVLACLTLKEENNDKHYEGAAVSIKATREIIAGGNSGGLSYFSSLQ